MTRVAVRWSSEELREALAVLSAQQARGVVRIVQAELDGRSIGDLLDCDDQICASTTFYRKRGWRNNGRFRQALDLARRDYRAWMMEHGTGEALSILASTAPDAARALRQRVVGDEWSLAVLVETLGAKEPGVRVSAATCLGQTGLPEVVRPLQRALQVEADGDVRGAIVTALGLVASGIARDMAAAESVLSRAAIETASKGLQAVTGGDGGPVELAVGMGMGMVSGLDDEELAQLLVNLETLERLRCSADGANGQSEAG